MHAQFLKFDQMRMEMLIVKVHHSCLLIFILSSNFVAQASNCSILTFVFGKHSNHKCLQMDHSIAELLVPQLQILVIWQCIACVNDFQMTILQLNARIRSVRIPANTRIVAWVITMLRETSLVADSHILNDLQSITVSDTHFVILLSRQENATK